MIKFKHDEICCFSRPDPVFSLIKGKVVAITPGASSKTINEAANWYRAELNKRSGVIDKSLSLKEQIIQAETLAQELMNGATASLFDRELAAALREAFARPSIEKLKSEVGGAGEKQLQAILEKSTKADNSRKWFEPGACFAAGTLVHTKEGLVPIEQIKVGDLVLSKHDSGTGKRAYKRVLNTFAHAPQRVIRVEYIADPAINRVTPIVCTVNHPFWVKGLGWTPAEDLYRSSRENMLETANGRSLQAHGTVNIYISDQPGVGWLSAYDNDTEAFGFLWDFIDNRFVAGDVVALDEVQHHQIPYNDPQFGTFPEELYLHLPVYNLEVEDFHTYYVGEHGVWVHNTNCGGLDFELKTPGPALTVEMQAKPFLTRAELEFHLKANNADSGVFLVRADQKSQVGLIDKSEIINWAVFEDGVPGRVVASDKSRWEYAAVIRHPETGKLTYISVEGVERSPTGLQVFVDRKLAFVKAGNELEIIKLLNRIAERLEKNPNDRWAFEFKPGIIKEELYALTKARALFDKIRRGDASVPVIQKRDGATGTFVADDVAMARIVAMLGPDDAGSLIQLRTVFQPSIFPQNVLTEGTHTTASLTLSQINALLPQARQYWLDAGASASLLGSASFQIDDLPTGLAGQSQGNVITLDASGAGWGWFVDSTPIDQAEFDAGASATSFTSSTSSPATGKLDLLTVLIHELGHVVSLPSTATANDVMSQYLAPGQRRLPNAVDIAALQANGSPYYSNGTLVTLVAPPASYGGSLSYGQLHPAAPVINPALANGNFTAAPNGSITQWETTGKVNIDSASSSTITLGESTTAQTHLAQAFVLSGQDRFLTFNVSNLALQNNSTQQNGILQTAPQDAFEVALTHANTGQNLLPALTTNHSDALLNIQLASSDPASTLQERSVAGLRRTDNADGSRTYLLDLSGIAAGTPVNLSFDLIGFGMTAAQLGSHVSIKDVRLVSTPVAVDDAATLLEDGSLVINAQANDLSPDVPGFAPQIVATAQHGQVSINADGTFGYTPEANFYGTDSFTYESDLEKWKRSRSVSDQPSAARNFDLQGHEYLVPQLAKPKRSGLFDRKRHTQTLVSN